MSTLITIQHINTIQTVGGRGGNQKRVLMLTIDGNGFRKAYRVSPEIEDQAVTELYSPNCRNIGNLTIEVEKNQVVNYYR